MAEILSTKLFVPPLRPQHVPRPRLIESLNRGLDRKLTLISAPAGFGKTTLLAEWIQQVHRPPVWLSLEPGDDDPKTFWMYFISALQQHHPNIGADALNQLRYPQPPPIQSLLITLINEITEAPNHFVIILDDYHAIHFQPIHEGITFLLNHLPDNLHLVITTRADPPLPLSRLRARDQLTELRAHHLRFTTEESASFFNRMTQVNLSNREVAALTLRTEGWIAGLQIAALSIQNSADIPGFIQSFSGSHRHILGYLGDEVLHYLPEETFHFLLRTSILERLCSGLCDAVTGLDNSQAVLSELEEGNLFLIPLDEEGVWYRYHHLFAEVLQARFHQYFKPEIVTELHHRASEWFDRWGYQNDAIDHAILSGDWAWAGNLIAKTAPEYIHLGELQKLRKWMEHLPDEQIFANDDLLTFKGWVLYFTSQTEQGRMYAEKSRSILTGSSSAITRGRVACLLAQYAIIDEDIASAHHYAVEALELLGEEDLFFRSLTLSVLSGSSFLFGNSSEAVRELREAARIGESLNQPLTTMAANANLVYMLNWRGALQEARELCEHVLNLYTDARGMPLPISGIVYVAAAKLAYEADDREQLHQYLATTLQLQELLKMPRLALEIQQAQLLECWANGDIPLAIDFARAGYQIATQSNRKGYISRFAALEGNLQALVGNYPAADERFAAAHISLERGDDLLRTDENILYARYLLMQERLEDASGLLTDLEVAVTRVEFNRHLIAIMILKALLSLRQRNPEQALESLGTAIRLAAREDYQRVFINESEWITPLLLEYRSICQQRLLDGEDFEANDSLIFIDNLLSAVVPQAAGEWTANILLPEPLSERELEVLRLLATGHSNQEIAGNLMIEISTVKSHLNRLYGKLGVHRRTQAIALAREQGLLSA